MRVQGLSGSIRWGYLTVARLAGGSGELRADGGTLAGSLSDLDAFRIEQAPLDVALELGASVVQYRVAALERDGAAVVLTLGARQ